MTPNEIVIWSLLLLIAAYSIPASAGEGPAPAAPDPPERAYLDCGQLYYFQVKDRWAMFMSGPRTLDELWQVKLTLEGPLGKKRKQLISCMGLAGDRLPDRWRICDGFFLWIQDHESQGGQDSNHSELYRIPLEKVGMKRDSLGGSLAFEAGYCCDLPPIYIFRKKSHDDTPDDAPREDTYFDVIPHGKDGIHVLLAWRGKIRVLRGAYRWYEPSEKERKPWQPQKMPYIKWDNEIPPTEDHPFVHDARPVLRVRTEMREGFFAYQNQTHFFFITISGKLYACRKRGGNQRAQLLWNDATSPIRAIIHDTTSHKTFAFTKASGRAEKTGRHVFFELAPKLEPMSYDPRMVPEWKSVDPLPSMMEYARVVLWNVPPPDWTPPSGEMSSQQQQQCWVDLSSTDIAKAHRAVWRLKARGAETVTFLKNHLQPVPVQAQERLDQLLAALDSDSFDRREVATRELSRGIMADSALEKALSNHPSHELRRRLEAILKDLPDWGTKNPELLREICAVRLLRQLGTPEAKTLLEKLAHGAPSAQLTRKAKDALQALGHPQKR